MDNRYKIFEDRTGERYTSMGEKRAHEAMESPEERLAEYGYLGANKVEIRYAENNKPRGMENRRGE